MAGEEGCGRRRAEKEQSQEVSSPGQQSPGWDGRWGEDWMQQDSGRGLKGRGGGSRFRGEQWGDTPGMEGALKCEVGGHG